MIEMYLMIFLCVIIALAVGVAGIVLYAVWVVLMHDIEKKEGDE